MSRGIGSEDVVISVILPTLNEADNLTVLIPRIVAVFNDRLLDKPHSSGSPYEPPHRRSLRLKEILVVDDSSGDGTPEVARALSDAYPVVLIERSGARSLSEAVIEGFGRASGEIVVVMDADLSHPPEILPALIEPILAGSCGMTIGSRYLAGGGCSGWPWYRLWGSRIAGAMARGVTSLSDPTSGLMAIRRASLQGVPLSPCGWKIVLEVAVRSRVQVCEIPFVFADRHLGKSKARLSVTVQYLWHLVRLYRYRAWKRLAVFAGKEQPEAFPQVAIRETPR